MILHALRQRLFHFGNGDGCKCADFGMVRVAVGVDSRAVGAVVVGMHGGLKA